MLCQAQGGTRNHIMVPGAVSCAASTLYYIQKNVPHSQIQETFAFSVNGPAKPAPQKFCGKI